MWQAINSRRWQWPAVTATRQRCNIVIRAIVINMSDSNETTSLSTSSSAVIVGDIVVDVVVCVGVGVLFLMLVLLLVLLLLLSTLLMSLMLMSGALNMQQQLTELSTSNNINGCCLHRNRSNSSNSSNSSLRVYARKGHAV